MRKAHAAGRYAPLAQGRWRGVEECSDYNIDATEQSVVQLS